MSTSTRVAITAGLSLLMVLLLPGLAVAIPVQLNLLAIGLTYTVPVWLAIGLTALVGMALVAGTLGWFAYLLQQIWGRRSPLAVGSHPIRQVPPIPLPDGVVPLPQAGSRSDLQPTRRASS